MELCAFDAADIEHSFIPEFHVCLSYCSWTVSQKLHSMKTTIPK